MPIEVNLDLMLVKRKMTLTMLSNKVGITIANLSILKQGHARAIRFSTLESYLQSIRVSTWRHSELQKRSKLMSIKKNLNYDFNLSLFWASFCFN